MPDVIRPELPGVERRPFAIGQVWTVDGEPGCRWFVLTSRRIIALFAGGADHWPESLVHTYGDRLRLEQIATVYAQTLAEGKHGLVLSGERDDNYIAICAVCRENPLAGTHRGIDGRLIP